MGTCTPPDDAMASTGRNAEPDSVMSPAMQPTTVPDGDADAFELQMISEPPESISPAMRRV
jgi:hypothetical protein